MSGEIIDLAEVSNTEVEILDFRRDQVTNKNVEILDYDYSTKPACGGCAGRNPSRRREPLPPVDDSVYARATPQTVTPLEIAGLIDAHKSRLHSRSRFGPDRVPTHWTFRGKRPDERKRIVPVILHLARDVPADYSDRGCGQHRLTADELALLLAGYEHAETAYPAPPTTYDVDLVSEANFPEVEPEAVLGSLVLRPAGWKRAFVEALADDPSPARVAAAAALSRALRPPTEPPTGILERDLELVAEWIFDEWLAELVVFDGYDDPGRGVVYDEGGAIRRVGGWYKPTGDAMPTPCWRADFPFPSVDAPSIEEARENARSILGRLRERGIVPDSSPPPGGLRYRWPSDDRQWPRDHFRPPATYPSRLLEFDTSSQGVFEWIEFSVSVAWPAPLHAMVDPRDGIPWKQKQIAARFQHWARFHGGTVAPEDEDRVWEGIRRDDADGTERFDGVRMLEAYLARRNSVVLPGWRAAARSAVEDLAGRGWPFDDALAAATAIVQPEDETVDEFYQHGIADVRYVGRSLSGENREAVFIVEGWFKNPPGSWKICISPSGGECSEEEFCLSRERCFEIWEGPSDFERLRLSQALSDANRLVETNHYPFGLGTPPPPTDEINRLFLMYFSERARDLAAADGSPIPDRFLLESYAEFTRGTLVVDESDRDYRTYMGLRDPFALDSGWAEADFQVQRCVACGPHHSGGPGTYYPRRGWGGA